MSQARMMTSMIFAMMAANELGIRRRDVDPFGEIFEPGSDIFINRVRYQIAKPKPKTFPPEVLEKLAQFPQTREGIKAKKAYLKSLKTPQDHFKSP